MKLHEKWMVIGGAGAIGNNLIRRLLKHSSIKQIIILDNLSSGSTQWLPKDSRVLFRYCDICDYNKLKFEIQGQQPNYIVNLAAHFANQNSVDFPLSDVQTNIIGVINIFEASKELKNLKKIVSASSSCVYGSSEYMSENDFIYPYETPYAINKLGGELYTKYYSDQFGIPAVSVRIFNTYGPYELPGKYRNVIPNFFMRAINNEELSITGDGDETRDFTFSDDTCEGVIKAAYSKYSDGSVFNLGAGNRVKIKDLANEILKISHSNSKITYSKMRSWDHVKHRQSNISKSKELLGYSPETKLTYGLKATYKWLMSVN